MKCSEFDDEMLERLGRAAQQGRVIPALTIGRPTRTISIARDDLGVTTEHYERRE